MLDQEMGTLGRAIYTVGFWVCDTGQALDRLGSRFQGNHYFQEQRDVNSISIGAGTNTRQFPCAHGKVLPTIIGDNVTIGHSTVIHGCTVEYEAFVGMGVVLLDGVMVEKHAMIAAAALVRQNTRVPAGEVCQQQTTPTSPGPCSRVCKACRRNRVSEGTLQEVRQER